VKKYYFLLEACEYQRHFLTLDLDNAIITSLELEHTDYFRDWEDYESAFLELIDKLKGNVFVLPTLNSENILHHKKTVIIQPQHFDFQHLRGTYQQQNASLVFGLLDYLTGGAKPQEIKKLIESFGGLRRRMETLTTTKKGAMILSDYGHVASSLEGGLQALKERFPDKKLICIFQPHQMHRILQGRDDFPKALAGYDERFIYRIYAAREDVQKITEDFGRRLQKIAEDCRGLQKIAAEDC
jgi:UDP-N-acetylmuramate--alanine ligase